MRQPEIGESLCNTPSFNYVIWMATTGVQK